MAVCQADPGPTKSRERGISCEMISVEQTAAAGDIGDTAACAPPTPGTADIYIIQSNLSVIWIKCLVKGLSEILTYTNTDF